MTDCLFSKEYDGTIVTPTAVVESNKDKFQGFVIVSNCDHGTRHLKLIHKYGVAHSTYPMAQRNGLWFHTYAPLHRSTPKVRCLNVSCHSALWHGRLGCTDNNAMY